MFTLPGLDVLSCQVFRLRKEGMSAEHSVMLRRIAPPQGIPPPPTPNTPAHPCMDRDKVKRHRKSGRPRNHMRQKVVAVHAHAPQSTITL